MSLKPTMTALNKAFALSLLALSLTACWLPTPPPPPPPVAVEVPFASDPSVMRGDWVASLSEFPENSRLFLEDVVATCETQTEDICETYTFIGTLRIDDSEPVAFSGTGNSGSEFIYTLRSPVYYPPPSIEADFKLNDTPWRLQAEYLTNQYPEGETVPFSGVICEDTDEEGISCPSQNRKYIELEPLN